VALNDLPLLPTSVMGSHAKPGWLYLAQEAIAQGRLLGSEDLAEIGDDAVRLAIADMEELGVDVISDGEMRRTGGYYQGQMERIENIPFMDELPLRALGPRHYDFTGRKEVVGPIKAPNGLGILDDFKFLQAHTTKPAKVTCAGPLNFAREIVLTSHYNSTLELAYDFSKIINAELKALVEAGADFIQIDEPSYVHVKEDPKDIVDLFNATVEGINAKIALHICFGNNNGRPRIAERTYGQLFPAAIDMKTDQFVLEFANRQMAEIELWKEFDVPQELGAGLIDVKAYIVETPEEVAARIRRVLQYVPAEKLWINPDCGFGMTARWTCVAKLKAMVEGTRQVRQELGV
jgi:5-methyltetrahydropteroyltriglutamate--homocysteine methyltransferase